jgi:hypothetical protein
LRWPFQAPNGIIPLPNNHNPGEGKMARWTAYTSIFTALIFLSITGSAATLTAATLTPNSLVITEYLANPIGVSDSEGEYFEIFNTTNFDIDLSDLIIRDDGSNSFTVSGLFIAAGSFAVLSNFDGVSLGFTPDYIYSASMSLTNTDDEIGLFRPDDTLINKVAYSDGDFFGEGIAHELSQLSSTTPTLLFGPQLGSDYIAAVAGLPLGNFGSPGYAGGTSIELATVPVPAAVWMFGSALSILGWIRRRTAAPGAIGGEVDIDEQCAEFVPAGRGPSWLCPGRLDAMLGRI